MTLTEFLTARIAEDEEVARESKPGPWAWKPYRASGEMLQSAEDSAHTSVLRTDNGWAPLPADAEHIVRHDPARVLAECEAKRRIVKRETATVRLPAPGTAPPAPDLWLPAQGEEASPQMKWWIETYTTPVDDSPALRDLASVYADHPDYDEAWRP